MDPEFLPRLSPVPQSRMDMWSEERAKDQRKQSLPSCRRLRGLRSRSPLAAGLVFINRSEIFSYLSGPWFHGSRVLSFAM